MSGNIEYSVQLQGGLGNQLFGWAAATSLAQRNHGTVSICKSLLKPGQYQLGNYISEPPVSEMGLKKFRLTNPHQFTERDFRFDDRFNKISTSVALNGYFQSWKYFSDCEEIIKQNFTALANPSKEYLENLNLLTAEPFTAIHVRRGDYIGLTEYHGLTSYEYYQRAAGIASKYGKAFKTVVFSDDLHAAKEVVDWGDQYIGSDQVSSAAETLDLMSHATNFIGSNSSFSWWSGYLRDDETGVRIFPRPWFAKKDLNERDLLRKNWISIGI
jgi:hypothetical protein